MSDDGDPATGEIEDGTDEADAATETADDGAADAEEKAADESAESVEAGDLVERAAEHDDSLADEVETLVEARDELAARVDDLEADLAERQDELEDLESRLKRKQADFENYKKRRKREEEKIRERATEDLVERLLDVRDNLVRALEDDHEDVEGLREGVKMTLNEFDRVLDAENVKEIDPEPGAEVDPGRHEVMMRVESDQPDGTVADVYQPGYEMAGKVLRSAKVTVSEGADEDETEEVTAEEAGHGDDAVDGNET